MVLSVALFDKPAFKNVIVNGLMLAEDGKKMSKRLKNYPDPVHVVNSYGADALRLYMINSPVVRTEDLCFSEDGVKQVLRDVLIPLWNAYSFFVTYANIDGWHGDGRSSVSTNVLDRWIRSSLESLAAKVTSAMDNYDLQNAARPFVGFINDLTNWYIRRSRRRFWKSQDDDDKEQAYRTLSYVLLQLSKIAAPFVPFISENIYRNLRSPDMPESVHLCDFPVPDGKSRDEELEEQMAEVMTVVKLGRLLRAEKDLKIRQPLASMHIVSRNPDILKRIEARMDIIIDELNVRKLEYGVHETQLAELKAKPDFKRMGPRLGGLVKAAAGCIAKMNGENIERLLSGEKISINVHGNDVELDPMDIIVERIPHKGLAVASEGSILVALKTELTPDLIQEGLAREFVNKIQNMRKTADFEVTQRIKILFTTDAEVRDAVAKYQDYIKTETLCIDCGGVDVKSSGASDWDINGHTCAIEVIPVKQ